MSRMKGLLGKLRRAVLDTLSGTTDGQLLTEFIGQRNDASFEALVERHGPMVWGVCRRFLHNYHDAEDAFQATFLVLLRKAESIVPREMVANWLYGVAYQTAINARALAARRKQKQKFLPEPSAHQPADVSEEQRLLDQEINRLPANHRLAIVLCELEGLTRKEAADQLRVPEGTLASWLARAKAKLVKRLARHGPISAGAVAVLLAQNSSVAAVPNLLRVATIRAASLLAAGQNAAGAASPGAVILSEGVIKMMFAFKWKTWAAILLAPLFCACLVVGAAQTGAPSDAPDSAPAAKEPQAPPAVAAAAPEEKEQPADPPPFSGIKFKRMPETKPKLPNPPGGFMSMYTPYFGKNSNAALEAAVYNQTVAELEQRVVASGAGKDIDPVLLDALDRAISMVMHDGFQAYNLGGAKKKVEFLTPLSKQAEEVRVFMANRTKDKKLDAAKTQADLHRARALCLRINYGLWVAETEDFQSRPKAPPAPPPPEPKGPELIPVP